MAGLRNYGNTQPDVAALLFGKVAGVGLAAFTATPVVLSWADETGALGDTATDVKVISRSPSLTTSITAANDGRITANVDGLYKVEFSLSGSLAGSSGDKVIAEIFVNGAVIVSTAAVGLPAIAWSNEIAASGDGVTLDIATILALGETDYVTVRLTGTDTSTLTARVANLIVTKL